MKRALLLAIPLFAWTLSCASAQNEKKDPPKLVISKEAELIIKLTNEARVREKLNPLKPNALLFKCAEDYTAVQAKLMKCGHFVDGKRPDLRVDATGYDFKTCGENVAEIPFNIKPPVAKGQLIPTVFTGWMNSPIHKAEILRKEYEEIGIGMAQDKNGSWYFTQVFGAEQKKQ